MWVRLCDLLCSNDIVLNVCCVAYCVLRWGGLEGVCCERSGKWTVIFCFCVFIDVMLGVWWFNVRREGRIVIEMCEFV